MNREQMIEEFAECLEIQDGFNKIINEDWRNAGYDFILAAEQEASEAIDHFGWKWWKKQEPNLPQCRIELVDIFHFLLSESIVCEVEVDEIAGCAFGGSDWYTGKFEPTFIDCMRLISGNLFIEETWGAFFDACVAIDLSIEELIKLYKAKAVLNKFRQNYGYKEGTYVKNWLNGQEDNDYLLSVYEDCQGNVDTLNTYLAAEYANVLLTTGNMEEYQKQFETGFTFP